MIYLDTHVVVWLYAGLTNLITPTIHRLLNSNDIFISPIVRLELQYLYEINRITADPNTIVTDLSNRIGLQVDNEPFDSIIHQALAISWTRDPFDRIIVATSSLHNHLLVTKDNNILANFSLARW